MSAWRILPGDVLDVLATLPEKHFHCVVTSPPYWGLRDYGVAGQIGLEDRPDCLGWATGDPCGECFICHMVAVFRGVWRVLRDDGVCWINIGDTYSQAGKWGGSKGYDNKQSTNSGSIRRTARNAKDTGVPEKNLMMIPARLALALQSEGWTVRSDIIWNKPAPMPESVTDRPTKSHEHIYLLTKQARYFYDAEAVRIDSAGSYNGSRFDIGKSADAKLNPVGTKERIERTGRNLRDVWTIAPEGYAEAHFATFPTRLPELCIKAGSSERGCCPECGAPHKRNTKREFTPSSGIRPESRKKGLDPSNSWAVFPRGTTDVKTIDWQPTCDHDLPPIPCRILDPFAGAGTTLLVANQLGRDATGIELNPDYIQMAEKRIRDDAPMIHAIEENTPRQSEMFPGLGENGHGQI